MCHVLHVLYLPKNVSVHIFIIRKCVHDLPYNVFHIQGNNSVVECKINLRAQDKFWETLHNISIYLM